MPHLLRSGRLPAVAFAVATAAIGTVSPPAFAGPAAPDAPTAIQVGDGHKPYLVGHAVGVQIYSCAPTAGGYAWSLVAPRATLYGDNGQPLATHYAGPTWEARDGSTVKAARVDGVTVDPTAIPWLKLKATSASAGADGDRLAATTYIQRINTAGGLAPAAATCNADTAGTQSESPYTADYVFWKATSGTEA